jgi:hypothetical protein
MTTRDLARPGRFSIFINALIAASYASAIATALASSFSSWHSRAEKPW